MMQSRLLQCSLIIALATIGIWANEDVKSGVGLPSLRAARVPQDGGELPLWSNFEQFVAKKEDAVERYEIERIPDSTKNSPKEQAAPAITTPQPTAPPRKRQDNGQIQALSEQLRSLSQSATQAISSVSSSASSAISLVTQSAQSVRQSADQAVRSASQNADSASRQLSQASDDMSRSLSSMSSRLSFNFASAQSSASSAISVFRAEASSSAANAINIAASQIQAARANPSGTNNPSEGNNNNGDTSSTSSNGGQAQTQSNSVSGTTIAIIVSVSVVGTAILTAIASFFIVRYRRKKRLAREGLATPENSNNEKQYEKPIAVRGPTPESPRFTPFGGGTGYPMDKFKLPDMTLSPFLRKKTNTDSRSSIGFARSDYNPPASRDTADVYGVSPTSFRLQKDNSIKSATSVRLIRVGSATKGKPKAKEEDQKALLSPIASSPLPPTTPTVALPIQPEPVVVPPSPPQPPPEPRAELQPIEPPSPTESTITAPPPIATRSPPRKSLTADLTFPLPPPTPPSPSKSPRRTTAQSRLRFRDSSDIESAEPSPAPTTATAARTTTPTSMRNTNTASLRATGRPKNAGPASFATFPRIRNGPPRGSAAEAMMNRTRGLKLQREEEEGEEERRRGSETDGRAGSRDGSSVAVGADTASRGANWPFGNG